MDEGVKAFSLTKFHEKVIKRRDSTLPNGENDGMMEGNYEGNCLTGLFVVSGVSVRGQ